MSTAFRAGAAFAATAALAYAVCTLVFFVWPGVAASFVNAMLHGNFDRFVYVLVVLVIWAFWLGAFFGWLFDRLGTPRLALRRS